MVGLTRVGEVVSGWVKREITSWENFGLLMGIR